MSDYKGNKDVVIVTIPRGGVPIGRVLARELHAPLELVLSKKIGHPFHKEFAIGAVTLQDKILSPQAAEVPEEYIEKETKLIRDVLKKRYNDYYGIRMPLILTGKIVIIVDDGVATGNTLISCIELINEQQPAHIIVALPVAPPDTIKVIKELPAVSDTVCLLTPSDFYSVGQSYEYFRQVSDVEAVQLIKEANANFNSLIDN